MSSPTPDKPVTVPSIRSRKRSNGMEPVVMLTAYDEPSARIASDAGVDIVLIGDSVANNVLGYDDTLQVDLGDIAHHVGAVSRARPRSLIVGDMPWMSYHLSVDEAVRNASILIRAGAHAVKLEGGHSRVPVIKAIIDAEIPVMGHLGLTPQSVLAMGGYRVQAKNLDSATRLIDSARELSNAGCFAIVLEGIPSLVAQAVTAAIDIPTIGIGAGAGCDGQVLVFHDVLGLGNRTPPKFVRQYADLAKVAREALGRFADDVRSGRFPNEDESYQGAEDLSHLLDETI